MPPSLLTFLHHPCAPSLAAMEDDPDYRELLRTMAAIMVLPFVAFGLIWGLLTLLS